MAGNVGAFSKGLLFHQQGKHDQGTCRNNNCAAIKSQSGQLSVNLPEILPVFTLGTGTFIDT